MTGGERQQSVVMIAGPTASGKSGLAAQLARALGGVVINADSMQVYRELAVLTARPRGAVLETAPHRLYGVLSGAEPCSAGHWRALAMTEVREALAQGRLPILVGGTGLYLRSFEEGLSAVPEIPAEVRAAARATLAEIGPAALHAKLAAGDPEMAARLAPGDSQRVVRAWEVLQATGRSLAQWQAAAAEPAPFRFVKLCLMPPRAALYAACNRRLEAMLEEGALEEVERLLDLGLDPGLPIMKAVGVPELAGFLRGSASLDDALGRAQQATRRYAKRQTTWLRHQFLGNDQTIMVIETQYSESLMPELFSKIRQILLTDPG